MYIMNQLMAILQTELDTQVVTVAHLSKRLGCSRQHIYNILNGNRKPTLDFAERLAAELGLTLSLAIEKKSRKIPA